ncbi:MAG: COX15/CtaA family protein [Bacteroidota bacterium]
MPTNYHKSLHRFALLTAICTFFLIIAGGLVTSTGSGLAVPDWPLSYGQIMPPMVGGIFYEHGHRMVATFVGVLAIILAVWLWKKEERRWLRVLGLIALSAVILQGVLGGLTVLYLLPTAISVSHAALAQTFFAIVISIALFTSRWWKSEQPLLTETGHAPSTLTLCIVATGAVYLQLILGALMRHTDSGLAVPDFPLAYGQLFPALSSESIEAYNKQLIYEDIRLAADGPLTSGQIIIHMVHRLWAAVVAVLILWTSLRLRELSSSARRISRFSYLLVALLIVQIALGALTVFSGKAVEITTAHVATGAVLLVSCVLTSLHLWHVSGIRVLSLPLLNARKEAVA